MCEVVLGLHYMRIKHQNKIKKLMKGKSVEELPKAKARPGAWKAGLIKRTQLEIEEPHKNTEIPPIVQDQIVNDVANGKTSKEISAKYKISLGYAKEIMLRRFGSPENMKTALIGMAYENAMVFMGFAAHHIDQFTAPQAVLAAKLSIDSGLALEKSEKSRPEEINFSELTLLGATIGKIEKIINPDKVKELPAS